MYWHIKDLKPNLTEMAMTYITRSMEALVQTLLRSYKALLITGPRQVGKSTLLKQLFPERRYITLDDPFLEEQAKNDAAMFFTLNPPPLTIDEAQRAPILFRHIKMACDESADKGLFLLTGSQHFLLMKDVSESLAGRIGIIELSGLSLREIQSDPFSQRFIPTMDYILARQKTVRAPANIWDIIHRGSYPELQKPETDWATFYGNYVKTYIERDIRELTAVQNLDAFRRFVIAAAARTGQVLNYSNLAEEAGVDMTTAKRWLSLLESSGIIYLLEPYAASALKRAIKAPKLYFRDTGLACYLTRWLSSDALAYGAMSGPMFETFAISEILKSFANAGLDYRNFVSYYRGRDKKKISVDGELLEMDAEIDLIIEENGVLHPVEIKKNANVSPADTSAFLVLDKIAGKTRGMGAVLCSCPQPGALRENVLQIPLWYI
jgi:predicted AAA+ superfamily ATPase